MLSKVGQGIDFFFNKLLPKKFIVFIVACILVFMDKITGEQWFWIAGIYIGMNVTGKITNGVSSYLENK